MTKFDEQQLAAKQQVMIEQSHKIIQIADNEPQSALKCIHLLSVAGGALPEAYVAIEQRIMDDNDVTGAYHLCLMAQTTPGLPVDARTLIEMVVSRGDDAQRLSLLKNLPVPPVEAIKQHILDGGNADIIAQMHDYLAINPEGVGAHDIFGSSQKERIVPLSEDKDDSEDVNEAEFIAGNPSLPH